MTKITLLLAQGPDKPDGDLDEKLTMHLVLTGQGLIDPAAYESTPEPWLAERSYSAGPARMLEVIRLDEGWALQSTASLDDPIWLFEGHVYRPGELVRVQRPDGKELLFRIVNTEFG